MKRKLCILIAFVLISMGTFAQVASYVFSQPSGTYDTLTDGTSLNPDSTVIIYYADAAVPAGSSTISKGVGIPIGFNFTYNGSVMNVIGVCSNGWISFGQDSVNMNTSATTTPISATSTASAVLQNRVSAFSRSGTTNSIYPQKNSKLTYKILGTAPNRIFVIEWKKFRRNTTVTNVNENINFQIRLYETTNYVQIVYGTVAYGSTNISTVQVGLRGQANTDFNNRTGTAWATTTAGTVNTATVSITTSICPTTGLTFTWAPPVVTQYNAGLTAINAPVTPVASGSSNVSVTVKNWGTDSLKTATIGWSVNGTVQTPYSFIHAGLAKDSVFGPVTIGAYNFTTAGAYILKAWTYLPNGGSDGYTANDTVTKTVYLQGYASLPFSENFNGTWINKENTRDVPSMYWKNTPITSDSSWRRNDDGVSALWTNATTGTYTTTGTLYSARFHTAGATTGTAGKLDAYLNFSTVGKKMLKFRHINTSGTDTLSVLMSNDGGNTFTLIQKFATASAWTERILSLGTSTAVNTIIRFSVKKTSTNSTDVGLDSVRVNILAPDDAGLTAMNAPVSPVPVGSNPVTVTVMNYGADSLKNVSIGWSVNGSVQTSYPYTNSGIATSATAGPVSIGSYNYTTPGLYTIKAWTSLPNGNTDADHTNDTISKTVYVQTYAAIPYIENFDSTWVNKNDTLDVPSLYWSNTPAYGNNSWRRNDDIISGSWTSPSLGAYTVTGANSTIHSARFHSYTSYNSVGIMDLYINMDTVGGKMLDFWYINPAGNDSLSVYLSTNNGTSFGLIKKYQTATAWTQDIVNIGNSTSTNCVLRFKGIPAIGSDDMGIDQVQVYMQPADDMQAVEWVSPVSGCGLTNAESVTVKFKNVGTASLTNIPVKYSINAGTTIIGPEYIAGPVAPDSTVTYTFATKADFSTTGIYECGAVVKMSTDVININDTVFIDISSSKAISAIPFVENFNTGSSDYMMLSANNEAAISYDTIGTSATYGIYFTGAASGSWSSGATTANAAWNTYTTHQAFATTCQVTDPNLAKLNLKFDLRQTSGSTAYMTYNWFGVVVNGDTLTDIAGNQYYHPTTANADVYASKYFDLSAYSNNDFTIKFISSCRKNNASSTSGVGDNVYFDNFTLYVPPTINDLGNDTSICQGSSLVLDAGAGTGYSYQWTKLPATTVLATTQTYTVTATGNYQVVVTDASGYSAADAITVTVNALPVANAGTDTTVAYPNTIATLHGTATPTGTYTYSWSPASSLVDATLQNPTTIALSVPTIFTLTVTSAAGCVGTDQVTVNISGGPLSVAAYASPDTICWGKVSQITALVGGGKKPYIYSWTSTPAGFTSDQDTVDIYPAMNTTYNVMVTDSNNNTATSSVTVTVIDLPFVNLGVNVSICSDEIKTLDALNTGSTYLWSTGEITQKINIDFNDATDSIASIWVRVTNANDCISSDTIKITFIDCTGITEYGANPVVNVSPNPTNGLTNITVSGLDNTADLNIFTLQGQLVYNSKVINNSKSEIDLSGLPKGVYFVRISNDKANSISKLILE